MPTWATGMADIQATLPFDSMQTIMFAAINNRLGLAIADSGVYKMAMDLRKLIACLSAMLSMATAGGIQCQVAT